MMMPGCVVQKVQRMHAVQSEGGRAKHPCSHLGKAGQRGLLVAIGRTHVDVDLVPALAWKQARKLCLMHAHVHGASSGTRQQGSRRGRNKGGEGGGGLWHHRCPWAKRAACSCHPPGGGLVIAHEVKDLGVNLVRVFETRGNLVNGPA